MSDDWRWRRTNRYGGCKFCENMTLIRGENGVIETWVCRQCLDSPDNRRQLGIRSTVRT